MLEAIRTTIIGYEKMTFEMFMKKHRAPSKEVYNHHPGYRVRYNTPVYENPWCPMYDTWSPKDFFKKEYTPISAPMSAEHAIHLMKRGKKIRLVEWKAGKYIYLNGSEELGYTAILDENDVFYVLNGEEITADTWEIVE